MERRTFMKYTAAAGASLMLHPFEILAINPSEKIKLAQVGKQTQFTIGYKTPVWLRVCLPLPLQTHFIIIEFVRIRWRRNGI